MHKPHSSRARGRVAALIAIAVAAWVTGWPATVSAQSRISVSIELVLAVDTSLSVDDEEFELQMNGIANALRHPDVVAAIEQHDGVAVTLFQWSSSIDRRFMVPWHLLDNKASIHSFANKVRSLPRDPVRGFTGLGNAIDFGTELIADNTYEGRQKKIDVSGDGRSNSGILPAVSRREALARNIVINGLPVLIETFNLDTYFREKIIQGPGSFVEVATDYEDFARAMLKKLLRELTPNISLLEASPH